MSKYVKVETAQNVFLDYKLASVGVRAVAYLIDILLRFVYLLSLVLLLRQFEFNASGTFWVLVLLPALFYDLFCEIFFEGQSFGKRQMNLRVIALSGKQRAIGGYLLRWLFGIVDFLIFGPVVALLSASVTKHNQRIGDLLGGMIVVSLDNNTEAALPVLPDFEEAYAVSFPQVTRLTDQEIAIVEKVIESYGTTESKEALNKLDVRLRKLLEVQSDLPPLTFLKVVVKDYKYLTA